jgi:hypothetical protein
LAGPPPLSWNRNVLTFSDPRLPGGTLTILHLEAFCLPGGHDRPWDQTRIPHQTLQVSNAPDGSSVHLVTRVGKEVEVQHEARVVPDGVDFQFAFHNRGSNRWPVQWFQPACVRVDTFTGCTQSNYTARSFVFTQHGRTRLADIRRTSTARYLGGQVFLPEWIQEQDANPRPISPERLTNGVIGCVSADDRWILALASDRTFELFEGVYVCLHSDPFLGGLEPGETRSVRQKLYLLPNDPRELLRRYQADFQPRPGRW